MKKNVSIQTPMAKARGLGSAKSGVEHWWHQRITAIANIPLVIWLVYSIVQLKGASYAVFTAWLAEPVNAVLMILFVISTFYHAVLGTQVVVEDYIDCECLKIAKLIAHKLLFIAMGVACIFAVLKIAFM